LRLLSNWFAAVKIEYLPVGKQVGTHLNWPCYAEFASRDRTQVLKACGPAILDGLRRVVVVYLVNKQASAAAFVFDLAQAGSAPPVMQEIDMPRLRMCDGGLAAAENSVLAQYFVPKAHLPKVKIETPPAVKAEAPVPVKADAKPPIKIEPPPPVPAVPSSSSPASTALIIVPPRFKVILNARLTILTEFCRKRRMYTKQSSSIGQLWPINFIRKQAAQLWVSQHCRVR